jgi:hypothetical protein
MDNSVFRLLIISLLIAISGFYAQSLFNTQSGFAVQTLREGQSEDFDFFIDPPIPYAWQEIKFTPQILTNRKVKSISWDFGDGTDMLQGAVVSHEFEGGIRHRVRMIIEFGDNNVSELEFVSKVIDVGIDPIAGACPPDTFSVEEFGNSLVFSSQEYVGCVSKDIPAQLIDDSESDFGLHELTVKFDWEKFPVDVRVQAQIIVRFEREGESAKEHQPMRLTPYEVGFHEAKRKIDIPADVEIYFAIVVNLIDNPKEENIILTIKSLELNPLN